MPKRDPKTLSGERHAKGYKIAQTYDIPTSSVEGVMPPDAKAWRSGFAAGWAARDGRDDEPPIDGTMVWLVDHSGGRFVARRESADVWLVSGEDKLMTWREVLEDVAEWGLLEEVKYS